MQPHSTRIRVRYAETDQMGIVHHANYYVWMEVARVEFCREIGFRYRDMEEIDGVRLAVIETQCRYVRSAHFDDEVVVSTRILDANTRMVRFGYEMSVGGTLIAAGETRHIFLNVQMRPARLPEHYRVYFGLPAR